MERALHYSLVNGATKLKTRNYIDIGKYLCVCQNFSATGFLGGVGPPSVNLGSPNTSETTRARKLKLKMSLDIVKYAGRCTGGTGPPNVNLGPP